MSRTPLPPEQPLRRARPWGRAVAVAVLAGVGLVLLGGAAQAAPVHPVVHAALAGGHQPAAAAVVLAQGGEVGPDASIRKEAALAGYLSYGLMAMTVVWGIALSTGWAKRFARRRAVYSGHFALALTALTFGVVHALSYIFQTQERFSLLKTFVPFVQGGEIEVALGIVGLELMIGASVAVALIHKLNYRRFRKVHIGGTYLGAALSWVHVLTTSPEARAPTLVGVTVAAAALTCIVLGIIRLLPPSRADRARIALSPLDLEPANR